MGTNIRTLSQISEPEHTVQLMSATTAVSEDYIRTEKNCLRNSTQQTISSSQSKGSHYQNLWISTSMYLGQGLKSAGMRGHFEQ